jgi:hypothetical protein
MPVAAGGTKTRHIGSQTGAFSYLILPGDRQQGLDDAVLAPLVVDEAVWAELAQRKESRA